MSSGGQLLASYCYDYRGLRSRKVTTAAASQGAQTTLCHYDQRQHLIGESLVSNRTAIPQMTYVWRGNTITGIVVHQPTRKVYTVLADHLGSR